MEFLNYFTFESTKVSFFWIFLAFYFTHEAIQIGLDYVNYCYSKRQKDCPPELRNFIPEATFKKSKAYTLEKMRFSIAAHFAQIPFFWLLIFYNGFNVLDYYSAVHGGFGTLTHSVLFCVYLSLYFGVLSLPFKIYSIFVIEEKYGFNKMSFGLFVWDTIKSLIVGAILGVPLLYGVFAFMKFSGSFWWLWVWAFVMGFQIFIAAVYPALLAPLFNRFEPLKDQDLVKQILKLAEKIKFNLSGIFVVDGSRRSGHSNAYFAGMGKFRRIVLFDTLLKQLNQEELLAVLAHEMGHNVKKHIRNFMILSSALSLVGFYILSLLMGWEQFYQAFNISMMSAHTALVVFFVCSDVFTFMLTPFMNFLSRKNEYEADRFSVESTGDKEAMKGSLIKLSKENLSNMSPHPAYSFYHHSHPTTAERLVAINKIEIEAQDK